MLSSRSLECLRECINRWKASSGHRSKRLLDQECFEIIDGCALQGEDVDEAIVLVVFNDLWKCTDYLIREKEAIIQSLYCKTLQISSCHGNEEIFKLLLECGKKVIMSEKDRFEAQLIYSTRFPTVLQLLVKEASNIDDFNWNCAHEMMNALMYATVFRQAESVDVLLKRGASISLPGKRSNCLHYAASRPGRLIRSSPANDAIILRRLLECSDKKELNSRSELGLTPLQTAAKCGDIEKIEIFVNTLEFLNDRSLRSDAFQNLLLSTSQLNEYKQNFLKKLLSSAILKGNVKLMYLLLNSHNINAQIKIKDRFLPPLFLAAILKNSHIAIELLKHKNIDARLVDKDGRNVFHYAARVNNVNLLKVLLESQHVSLVDSEDDGGLSPLWWAAAYNNYEAMNILMPKVASTAFSIISEINPLFCAIRQGHIDAVKLILDHRSDIISAPCENNEGAFESPLHIALKYPYNDIASTLIASGADVNYVNGYSQTPLHYAALYASETHIKMLIDKRATIDAKDMRQETPLFKAIFHRNLKSTTLLLQHGSNIENKNCYGQTPLIYAIYRGAYDIVRLLIEKGADKNTSDQFGTTVICYCMNADKMGFEEIKRFTRLLIREGVKVPHRTERNHLLWQLDNLPNFDDDRPLQIHLEYLKNLVSAVHYSGYYTTREARKLKIQAFQNLDDAGRATIVYRYINEGCVFWESYLNAISPSDIVNIIKKMDRDLYNLSHDWRSIALTCSAFQRVAKKIRASVLKSEDTENRNCNSLNRHSRLSKKPKTRNQSFADAWVTSSNTVIPFGVLFMVFKNIYEVPEKNKKPLVHMNTVASFLNAINKKSQGMMLRTNAPKYLRQ